MSNSPVSVMNCFVDAWRLIFSREFRLFILVPLILNILVFILVSTLAVHVAQSAFADMETRLPQWLLWIKWLLIPLIIILLLIIYGYSFNLLTTIIAAPFLGLLAEKVQAYTTGISPPEEPLIHLIPRTFKREFIKLGYFIPRSVCMVLLVLSLLFLPGINLLGVLLGGLWSSWCLALQFCDYAADNHQIHFNEVRTSLSQKKLTSLTFGGLVLLGSMIPLLNIVITPLAVAAGTIYWEKYVSPHKKNPHNFLQGLR